MRFFLVTNTRAETSDKIAPLLFDTLVTAMTVWKAFHIRIRNGGANSKLIQTFLREGKCLTYARVVKPSDISFSGVFYYILISVANLVSPNK